jgi:hypothetical protein
MDEIPRAFKINAFPFLNSMRSVDYLFKIQNSKKRVYIPQGGQRISDQKPSNDSMILYLSLSSFNLRLVYAILSYVDQIQ